MLEKEIISACLELQRILGMNNSFILELLYDMQSLVN